MSKKRISLIVVIFLILGLSIAVTMRWQMKQGSRTPPPAGVSVMMEKVANAAELPTGFIVWSSNRYGNHDILKMDLPQGTVSQLTTNKHTEYFPRISPDGRYLVFARSQKPWVPQRNQKLWDIILYDMKKGSERLIASGGNTPTWSEDGKKIYYQSQGAQFVEIDVSSGEKKVLLSSGQGEVKNSATLYTPSYNSNNKKTAVTLHLRDYSTTIVDENGSIKKISWGCQVKWSKKGDFLYYVGHGGKMKNAFYLYDPVTEQSTKWLDLPGEFSHEYFPKLSNDEKYLVFAASKGGHEHDSADYEIFLWQVGSAAETATRMTHHTGNDNWPDVYLY